MFENEFLSTALLKAAKVIIDGEVNLEDITSDLIFMKTCDSEIHSFEEDGVLNPENFFNFYKDEMSAVVAGELICRQKNDGKN